MNHALAFAALVSLLAPSVIAETSTDPQHALAIMLPTDGHDTRGVITFSQTPSGVRIGGTVQGLTTGVHGIHIHEFGDCSAPDASSAGDHFNPRGHKHGDPASRERHVGDLGNLEGIEGRTTQIAQVDTVIALKGKDSIIGRSVVIHARPDDLKSQPSGNSGARVSCGVIGIAQERR